MSYLVAISVDTQVRSEADIQLATLQNSAECSRKLLEFLDKILELYPEPSGPEDDFDDCVWSDSPLANNIEGCVLKVGIYLDISEVLADIVDVAKNMNMLVYDYQTGKFYGNDSSDLSATDADRNRKRWWWPF